MRGGEKKFAILSQYGWVRPVVPSGVLWRV